MQLGSNNKHLDVAEVEHSRLNKNLYKHSMFPWAKCVKHLQVSEKSSIADWCYCGREVLFQKVSLFVVYKFVLHGKQFLAKQIRGID